LKITDLSDPKNPFVILKNRPVLQDGTILLPTYSMSPRQGVPEQLPTLLPWLPSPEAILRRTIKIEVLRQFHVIMSRYLHFGKLYPIEYPKLALLIAHNMYQQQYMRFKSA